MAFAIAIATSDIVYCIFEFEFISNENKEVLMKVKT